MQAESRLLDRIFFFTRSMTEVVFLHAAELVLMTVATQFSTLYQQSHELTIKSALLITVVKKKIKK